MGDSKIYSLTGQSPFDHAMAGFLAGAVSTGCMHPLDLIKTRLQVETTSRKSFRGDMRRVIQQIYQGGVNSDTRPLGRHALRRFYQGLSPNLVGATLSWGGYFWWFNGLKKYRYATDQVLTPTQQIAVSMEAGIYTACLTNPLWVVKTRMCLQPSMGSDAKYRSVPGALSTIWREEGVRGLYRGLVPALFGVGHGAIQFTCYEELKKRYRRQREGTIDTASFQHKIHPLHYLWMAATSKAVASLLTYPYQVIKSRLQASPSGYSGLTDVVVKTFRNEGVFGFYKGLVPNLIRVVPATCITYLTYESIVHLIQHHGPTERIA